MPSQQDDLEAAEARMNAAREALLRYTNREDKEHVDLLLQERLIADLQRATDVFLKILSELSK